MKAVKKYNIIKFKKNEVPFATDDDIIVEEPLEIFVQSIHQAKKTSDPFMVTMRTPGEDYELCVGLLFSLGIIDHKKDILSFKYLISDEEKSQVNIIISKTFNRQSIPGYTNSSCGVCNSAAFDDVSLFSSFPVYSNTFKINSEIVYSCNLFLDQTDHYFTQTGGNHKVSIINGQGVNTITSEDVGRHNAFDKVLGKAILSDTLPLSDAIAILSGRCSFEMCQKAWLGGIPIIASLGAPTSRAIMLAENAGITLIGFVKKSSFNIYTHPERIL